eukprot:365441-Chlamydomonas_euryale.AAC.10
MSFEQSASRRSPVTLGSLIQLYTSWLVVRSLNFLAPGKIFPLMFWSAAKRPWAHSALSSVRRRLRPRSVMPRSMVAGRTAADRAVSTSRELQACERAHVMLVCAKTRNRWQSMHSRASGLIHVGIYAQFEHATTCAH